MASSETEEKTESEVTPMMVNQICKIISDDKSKFLPSFLSKEDIPKLITKISKLIPKMI